MRTVGVALDEALDDLRQHVARLGVGGRDGEAAAAGGGEVLAQIAQVVHVREDALRGGRRLRVPARSADDAVAPAREDLETQF